MSARLTKREYYLNIARAVALRSTCLRRQYGAVIVKDDQIVSTGYNGAARGEDNCPHLWHLTCNATFLCDLYKDQLE